MGVLLPLLFLIVSAALLEQDSCVLSLSTKKAQSALSGSEAGGVLHAGPTPPRRADAWSLGPHFVCSLSTQCCVEQAVHLLSAVIFFLILEPAIVNCHMLLQYCSSASLPCIRG
jgi:hypothetical protein